MTQELLSQNGVPQGASEDDSSRSKKQRPTKVLPTDRITFRRQLDLLRAYAAASGQALKAVANADIAGIVSMNGSTVSLANAFFSEVRFLQKADGKYLPAPEVISYARAYDWNQETASHKLAPLIADSWFGRVLMPTLSFRPLEEDEAISMLADEAAASKEYRNQLRMLIDYMEAAGLAQRDGNLIRPMKTLLAATTSERAATPATPEAQDIQPSTPRPAISTGFVQPTEGTVQFHVSVKVDMAEFATWQADRIAAFFGGIAQVLAAKAAIEKGSSRES